MFILTNSNSNSKDLINSPSNNNNNTNNNNNNIPQPIRKKELIESYIRKPRYSVRRVALLCEWINNMHIWSNSLTILNLHQEICNGVLLIRIVKKLNPEIQFVHLNEKPLSKKAAIENIEQALGHIWRAKSCNNSRIPTAEQMYQGVTAKIAMLLNELFGVYIQRPLYKTTLLRMLKWYHNVLKQYRKPLPAYLFEEGDLSGIWPHFQSGTSLFCILYHFYGSTATLPSNNNNNNNNSTSIEYRKLDPLCIAGDPMSICEYRSNLQYVWEILRILGIEVIWTVEDWITNPDTEFVILQLYYIYEKCKTLQCALPPAQGTKAGLTSGPTGEALVVGLIFADAPSNLKFIPKSRKAVRLGYDGNSMPLLPVDSRVFMSSVTSSTNTNTNTSSTSTSINKILADSYLPRGMLSKDVRIGHILPNLKEAKVHSDRHEWNGRTSVSTIKENDPNEHVIHLLRHHHQKVTQQLAATTNGDNISLGGGTMVTNRSEKDFISNNIANAATAPISGSGSGISGNGKFQQSAIALSFTNTATATTTTTATTTVNPNTIKYEDLNKEIATLIQQLEEEMISAQKQIQQAEDNLAGKYVELEAAAHAYAANEYAQQFEYLEQERMDLEDEKIRLKDYFARKLALIKDRKEEHHKKAQEFRDAVALKSTLNNTTNGLANQTIAGAVSDKQKSSANSVTSNKRKTVKASQEIDLKQVEKGWIKLSSKMQTHNFHLRSKQEAAAAAFKVSSY
jgi:hypothetical protein